MQVNIYNNVLTVVFKAVVLNIAVTIHNNDRIKLFWTWFCRTSHGWCFQVLQQKHFHLSRCCKSSCCWNNCSFLSCQAKLCHKFEHGYCCVMCRTVTTVVGKMSCSLISLVCDDTMWQLSHIHPCHCPPVPTARCPTLHWLPSGHVTNLPSLSLTRPIFCRHSYVTVLCMQRCCSQPKLGAVFIHSFLFHSNQGCLTRDVCELKRTLWSTVHFISGKKMNATLVNLSSLFKILFNRFI